MRNKICSILFVSFLVIFSLINIIVPDKDISLSERRKLRSFPELKLSNEYISSLESYLLDQFVFRDLFRSIKAKYSYYVLNTLDNNKIYLKDNYIFKSEYPTDKKSVDNFIDKMSSISSEFTSDNNVYMITIPDKNYYLDSDTFLHIDYDYIFDSLNVLEFNHIDIRDDLNLESFYETDTHWKQEKLSSVVSKYLSSASIKEEDILYKENKYDKFYGVYYGESALNRDSETITYLTNDVLDNVSVEYFENKNLDSVYNLSKLDSMDSYEVFLDGASSFITILNNNASTDRELIVFRDSFGSSFIPLLINYYSKITVIDNRYISSKYYSDMIDFTNQDILFLYSTLLVNNSYTLKG